MIKASATGGGTATLSAGDGTIPYYRRQRIFQHHSYQPNRKLIQHREDDGAWFDLHYHTKHPAGWILLSMESRPMRQEGMRHLSKYIMAPALRPPMVPLLPGQQQALLRRPGIKTQQAINLPGAASVLS